MASQNPTAIFGICRLEASTPVAFGFNVSLKHQTSSQLTLKLLSVALIVSAVVTVHLAVDLCRNSTAKATPRLSLTSTEESHLSRLKTYGFRLYKCCFVVEVYAPGPFTQ